MSRIITVLAGNHNIIRVNIGLGLLISLLIIGWPLVRHHKTASLTPTIEQSHFAVDISDTAINFNRIVGIKFSSHLSKSTSKPDYALPTSRGQAPIISRIPTKQPVVFLTIDDGTHDDLSGTLFMQRHGLAASMFLNNSNIHRKYEYFQQLQHFGSTIQNHTVSHRDMTTLSYQEQKQEICENADILAKVYDHRPNLFRPPYGNYNVATKRAAHDCNMKAIIMWRASINNGTVQYQRETGLRPGDIVLMHFRPTMQQDLMAFEAAVRKANLQVALLEDWL